MLISPKIQSLVKRGKLTITEAYILGIIADRNGQFMVADLQDDLYMGYSTVQMYLSRLVKKGFIRRTAINRRRNLGEVAVTTDILV